MSKEDEDAEFFRLIGEAITRWGSIESKIFRVFRFLLHTDRQFAAILFYRVQSLSARFEMFGEILRAAYPNTSTEPDDHSLIEEWRAIKKTTDKLLPFRNMLAHHDVMRIGRDSEEWIQVGYSENQRYRGKKIEIEAIKAGDIRQHLVDLEALFNAVTDFMVHAKEAVLLEEPIQREFRERMGLRVAEADSPPKPSPPPRSSLA